MAGPTESTGKPLIICDPEKVKKFLESPEGQEALRAALEGVNKLIKELEAARHVTQVQLDMEITI